MRVLICGSRGWDDAGAIVRRVAELPDDAVVIHGGAQGADILAGAAANDRGLHTAVVNPLWSKYGKRAGHKRNFAMLDLQPDLVIAFTHGTPGTRITIVEARKRGIPVEVVQGAD